MVRVYEIDALRRIHMSEAVFHRLSPTEIEQLADQVLQDSGNDSYPVDLFAITEHLGIDVYQATFNQDVSGLIEKRKNSTKIYVNENDAPVRQRFTMAHELGHYFLHLKDTEGNFFDNEKSLFRNGGGDPIIEKEANQFAAALLMPEKDVHTEYFMTGSISELAYQFRVSSQAMEIRLKNMGLL